MASSATNPTNLPGFHASAFGPSRHTTANNQPNYQLESTQSLYPRRITSLSAPLYNNFPFASIDPAVSRQSAERIETPLRQVIDENKLIPLETRKTNTLSHLQNSSAQTKVREKFVVNKKKELRQINELYLFDATARIKELRLVKAQIEDYIKVWRQLSFWYRKNPEKLHYKQQEYRYQIDYLQQRAKHIGLLLHAMREKAQATFPYNNNRLTITDLREKQNKAERLTEQLAYRDNFRKTLDWLSAKAINNIIKHFPHRLKNQALALIKRECLEAKRIIYETEFPNNRDIFQEYIDHINASFEEIHDILKNPENFTRKPDLLGFLFRRKKLNLQSQREIENLLYLNIQNALQQNRAQRKAWAQQQKSISPRIANATSSLAEQSEHAQAIEHKNLAYKEGEKEKTQANRVFNPLEFRKKSQYKLNQLNR